MVFDIITYIIIFAAFAYSIRSIYLMFFKKRSACAGCAAGNLCNLKKPGYPHKVGHSHFS
jgi:hypothetical protein